MNKPNTPSSMRDAVYRLIDRYEELNGTISKYSDEQIVADLKRTYNIDAKLSTISIYKSRYKSDQKKERDEESRRIIANDLGNITKEATKPDTEPRPSIVKMVSKYSRVERRVREAYQSAADDFGISIDDFIDISLMVLEDWKEQRNR